jgi:hypothetical protein
MGLLVKIGWKWKPGGAPHSAGRQRAHRHQLPRLLGKKKDSLLIFVELCFNDSFFYKDFAML